MSIKVCFFSFILYFFIYYNKNSPQPLVRLGFLKTVSTKHFFDLVKNDTTKRRISPLEI